MEEKAVVGRLPERWRSPEMGHLPQEFNEGRADEIPFFLANMAVCGSQGLEC